MKFEDKLVRTFLAIPVPKPVGIKKNMLFSTIDEKYTVNWVKNENLHVTLKFLDYTKESEFPKLLEDMKAMEEQLAAVQSTSHSAAPEVAADERVKDLMDQHALQREIWDATLQKLQTEVRS